MRLKHLSLFWQLQLAGWAAFYLAMALSRVGRLPVSYMFAAKLPLAVYGIVASLVLRSMLKPLLARQASMLVVVTLCVLGSYVIGAVWTIAFNLTQVAVVNQLFASAAEIESLADLLGGTIYHAFSLVAWGFLYIGIKHHRAWQREREHALRAEALATKARLNALQHQLNPHFFFNSLNAVSTLVAERRNDEATTMIARLGDFLRATLGREGTAVVTLGDELGYAQRYLDIERARFESRLDVRFDVDDAARAATVPLLILQPLIENAIQHGIARLRDGGYVAVRASCTAERSGPRLRITVENSAPPISGPTSAPGIGLEHVRERLTMMYGHDQRFAVERDTQLFRVHLQIPISVTTSTSGARELAGAPA